MRDPVSLLNGAVMAGLLAGGAWMTVSVMVSPELGAAVTQPLKVYEYLNGRITSAIDGAYKEELPVRPHSVDILNAVTYVLFKEGRRGVVVGQKGWLFTSEEYDWTPGSSANLEANLRHVAAITGELKRRGIAVEIALVPEKSDIYANLLLKKRPAAHDGKYDAVRHRLSALTGAIIPNLRDVLLEARKHGDVFFPTDTHWSVAGAGVAAVQLASAFPNAATTTETEFSLKTTPTVSYSGDLLRFLQLGPFSALLPETADAVTPLVAVATEGSVDDFLAEPSTTSAPQVALVGTSYSANPTWSFEAQLKSSLGRDVVNLAKAGHGPMEPMEAFLKQVRAGDISVEAVIWEIPLRYLDDDLKDLPGGSG